MNLFLLRHGPAGRRDADTYPDDSLRPLTAAGEKQLRRSAEAMRQMKLSFDLILASPLTRTRQTAEIVAECLGQESVLRLDDGLAPGGDRRKLVRQLAALSPRPGNVLLVGHEPDMSALLALLASERGELAVDFKMGGLARLQVTDKLEPHCCATLKWLVTPRQLKLMA